MAQAKKKIAIHGFGLTGRLAALALYKEHQIDVFEAGNIDGEHSAGFVAAAMLAPLAESVLCDTDIAQMGMAAIPLWQKIISELSLPVFFQQAGSLVVAHQQDRGDLASFANRLKPINGFKPQSVSIEIANLEPELAARFQQGVFLPGEAQLDNRAFYHASLNQLKGKINIYDNHHSDINTNDYDFILDCRGMGAKGMDVRDMGVRGIDAKGIDAKGMSAKGIDAKGIGAKGIDAKGIGAKGIDAKGMGAKDAVNQLRGVRGEVIRLYAPEVTLNRPIRLMHPRYPIYIAPKPNHEFVIGATEIESQSNKPITVRSAMELLSAAYTVHSGFGEAEIRDMRAGLRPSLPDNRPLVEKQGKRIVINGLYRHGYLLAPKVVEMAIAKMNLKMNLKVS